MIMRATAVPALAALAVIHVLDLPGTLGPEPLVGIGYFGIIAVAIVAGGAMIARSHWLAWAAAGGSGGASLVAPGMRALPLGVPKLIVSSVASGDIGPYVGPADITMMYSVTDVQGLNSISRAVLANGAHALAGMVKARLAEGTAQRVEALMRPPIGITMFGVTTTAVQKIVGELHDDYECLVFHATGVGGRSMEKPDDRNSYIGALARMNSTPLKFVTGMSKLSTSMRIKSAKPTK